MLDKYFKPTEITLVPDEVSSEQGHDYELTTKDDKHTIMLSEIFKGNFSNQNDVLTFGEKYEDSMIGKIIEYRSEINDNVVQNSGGWIILGKQVNEEEKNDIIITPKNPIPRQAINRTLEEWTKYEKTIKDSCSNYIGLTGKLGEKDTIVKEVRSITLEDINNAVGFSETINSVTIGGGENDYAYPKNDGNGWVINEEDENYSSWRFPTEEYQYYESDGKHKFGSLLNTSSHIEITLEKRNNMKYIISNNQAYWVNGRSVCLDDRQEVAYFGTAAVNSNIGKISSCGVFFCFSDSNDGYDDDYETDLYIRPVVVLSAEILWNDVKDLIGNYATY